MGDGVRNAAAEPLADHRTHRAAQKLKFKRAGDHRIAEQAAGKDDQCILLRGRFLGLREAVLVALAVLELQHVLRLHTGADLNRLASSRNHPRRCRAPMRMWWVHFGQTYRLRSSSAR